MARRLRPKLYRRLFRLGRVQVVNECQLLCDEAFTDLCTGRVRLGEGWSGESYRVPCPFCRDGWGSLLVSLTSAGGPVQG